MHTNVRYQERKEKLDDAEYIFSIISWKITIQSADDVDHGGDDDDLIFTIVVHGDCFEFSKIEYWSIYVCMFVWYSQ